MAQRFSDILLNIQNRIYSYKLDNSTVAIPEFRVIKSKEAYFKNYSNAVSMYHETCQALSDLQFINFTLVRLSKEISASSESYQARDNMSKEIRSLKDLATSIIDSYKYRKDGLEQVVKLYSSFQYLMTSTSMVE